MKKKSESIYFVLFSSRVFRVRWQGLRIMKYVVDSNRQIIDLFERHTYKYVQKSWACGFSFSPFWHLSADLSYIKKNVIYQWTIRIFTNSQLSIKPQPEPSHRIRICSSLVSYSNGVNFGLSQLLGNGFEPFFELRVNPVQLKQWLA